MQDNQLLGIGAFNLWVIIMAVIFIVWKWYTKYRNNGTTQWTKCTYCKDCKMVYSQGGLNASVYVCRHCGEDTLLRYSFRYEDGVLEVKKRKG